MRRSRLVPVLCASLLSLGGLGFGSGGQIPGFKRPGLPRLDSIPGLDSVFKKGPAITTSIGDATYAAEDKDGFSPEAGDLFSLVRTDAGGFVLKAGAWAGRVESYCLHAGTYGPTSGDGYLDGPVKGPYGRIVTEVARRSYAHSEIEQHDVQTLLWALVARAKTSSLSGGAKRAAATLLTQKERFDLDGGALAILEDSRIGGAFVKQPPLLRRAFEAEARLRSALSGPETSYAELERIAVLTGVPGVGPGSREVPAGRWSLRKPGFYVRYLPGSYPTTRIEVWVPEGSGAVGATFDPAEHIAVPANTACQRLLQSGRAKDRRASGIGLSWWASLAARA